MQLIENNNNKTKHRHDMKVLLRILYGHVQYRLRTQIE